MSSTVRKRGAVVTTIHVVSDSETLCDRLTVLGETIAGDVRVYRTGRDVLEAIDRETPGCILAEFHLPDMDAPELMTHLHRSGFPLPIVFFGTQLTVDDAVQAMRSGAFHVLSSPTTPETIQRVLTEAVEDDQRHRSERCRCFEIRSRMEQLTRREREVLEHIVAAEFNREIADQLGVQVKTIEAHRGQVMTKMQARNVVDLVRMWHEVMQHDRSAPLM